MDVSSLTQIGPYRVERFIDAGAFAWVFEVRDPKFTGRRLALKMLMPEAAEGEELRRFESEARLLAQIDHPNVVTIFDFGRDEATGNFYYVMTYVDGPTLKTRLKEGPLPVDEALPLFIDLLDGLARIHDNGIVHRDIKPANVLLGRDGRARLADLGIARVEAERSQTRTGVAVGTALYMSPEQARGRAVDTRSDLFSIALTLYECLTGQVVYDHVDSIDSTSGMDVLMYIGSLVHTRREFEVRFDGDVPVPVSVQRIILKCLRLSPDDRFGSAREMRDALRGALVELSAPATAPATRARAVPPWALAGLTAVLVVAAGVGLWLGYWSPRQAEAARAARAADALAGLSTLAESALSVASAVRDWDRPGDAAILERVDDHVDRGDRYREDGATDLEAGSLDLALKNLERGRAQYLTACGVILDEMLRARVEAAAQRLRDRALGLADGGAEIVVPEAWGRLTEALGPTEAGAPATAGCDAAQAELARWRATESATPLADVVEVEMAAAWPRVLDAAYEEATTARMLAVAVPSEAREYRLALKEAKRFLLQGARHRRAEDPQAALNAYRSAEKGFGLAARIAPAAESRATALALASDIEQEYDTDLGAVAQTLEEAESAYAGRQWETAKERFDRATAGLKDLRQASAWRQAAVAARGEARAARARAMDEGAPTSAPTGFAQAEASLARADRALDSGDAREAELAYAAALEEFGEAQKRSIQALRDAGMKRATVAASGQDWLGDSTCADLAEEAGRAECIRAGEALAAGDAAIASLDAPAAMRQFSLALESYARARSAQVLWDATRPRPPVVVRRVPQRAIVEASPRQLYSFGVEATDPNGDVLRYRWTVDGELQAEEHGPTMKRRLDEGAEIAVTVDDGRGGELVERWRVEIVERSSGG
jgi:tRNA A-37 threonylcarbamoyl transferase component Bud32